MCLQTVSVCPFAVSDLMTKMFAKQFFVGFKHIIIGSDKCHNLYMSWDTAFPTRFHVRTWKTLICLCICAVQLESSQGTLLVLRNQKHLECRERSLCRCAKAVPQLMLYSRASLSRTRLFRITAYLEVKIWSLF